MSTDTLRIGFVGAGGIVRQRHAPGLMKLDGIQFAAVANRRPESTAAAAEEYGIRQTFGDWRQLVDWDGIDAVWCAAHPNLHRPVVEAALSAGKHVFCQARLALNYADAKAMLEAAQRSDRTTMVCPAPHYMKGERTVRRMLAEGLIGQPYGVVICSLSPRVFPASAPLHWRQINEISGLNTLDLGMMIEAQQRVLGYPRRVTAMAKTFIPTRALEGGGEGMVERPDSVTALVELDNGALVTFVVSGAAHHATEANALEIFGSEGTIRYLADGDRILVGKAGGELKEVPIPPDEARPWTVEADFVEAVRAGRRSGNPSFWDGLKYMELTEAIFRSVDTGQVVDLPFEHLDRPEGY